MACIRLKELEQYLQDVNGFEEPNIEFEQYITTPHIAAHMLYTIESRYGDISDKLVADLGCGTGMLSIGAALLGCGLCVGIEIDAKALVTCQRNIENTEINLPIDLMMMNVRNRSTDENRLTARFDTVIMNPPFGTRHEGADTDFLAFALQISRSHVYSLHKMSTVQHFVRIAKSLHVTCDVVAELNYNLDKTYKFQRRDSKDIAVALLQFSHKVDSSHSRTSVETADISRTTRAHKVKQSKHR